MLLLLSFLPPHDSNHFGLLKVRGSVCVRHNGPEGDRGGCTAANLSWSPSGRA